MILAAIRDHGRKGLGAIGARQRPMGDSNRDACVSPRVSFRLPYTILLPRACYLAVRHDLEEAAYADGSNGSFETCLTMRPFIAESLAWCAASRMPNAGSPGNVHFLPITHHPLPLTRQQVAARTRGTLSCRA